MATYTNSSLISGTILSPFYTNRVGNTIKKITIHHAAGVVTAKRMGEIFSTPGRNGSSNYGIGKDGEIYMYVPEKYRAWTSGSWDNDKQAITIEVSNSAAGGEWPISDVVYASLIKLCVDICKRNGIKRINYTGDKTGNLTKHKWFQATACPGPYLSSRFQQIADEINEFLAEEDDMTKEEKSMLSSIYQYSAPIYNTIKDIEKGAPWAKDTIQKLVSKGYLQGDSTGLALSYQDLRMYVINDRAGLYK